MLCLRPSTEDEQLRRRDLRLVTGNLNEYNEPTSPRVGCMGQVKGKNMVAGFPFMQQRCKRTNNGNTMKYFNINRFFSSKNLLGSPSFSPMSIKQMIFSPMSIKQMIFSPISKKQTIMSRTSKATKLCDEVCVSIVNMDPPLPVIKPLQSSGKDSTINKDSLWKRRCGGGSLNCVQLQQLHLPSHNQQPTSV